MCTYCYCVSLFLSVVSAQSCWLKKGGGFLDAKSPSGQEYDPDYRGGGTIQKRRVSGLLLVNLKSAVFLLNRNGHYIASINSMPLLSHLTSLASIFLLKGGVRQAHYPYLYSICHLTMCSAYTNHTSHM